MQRCNHFERHTSFYPVDISHHILETIPIRQVNTVDRTNKQKSLTCMIFSIDGHVFQRSYSGLGVILFQNNKTLNFTKNNN